MNSLTNHFHTNIQIQEKEWKYLKGSLKYAMQDEKLTRMEMQDAAMLEHEWECYNTVIKLCDFNYLQRN